MRVQIPEAFAPLFRPHRYKAAFGGRGSGKSHNFAAAIVVKAAERQMRVLCCREIQKSIKDSVKRLIEDKISEAGLRAFYTSTDTEIRGANGSLILFAGLRTNPDSIKSMEGLDIAWIEEANRVSRRSLDLLIPTLRKEGSEIWASWNPESELDPIDAMFRGKTPPPDSAIMAVSYRDNPWFPEVLRGEMAHDLATDPDKHAHIWEGAYRKVAEGAYYSRLLSIALTEGRIGRVPHDPGLEVHASFDLGRSDATAVWFSQWTGRELRLIEYLENTGVGIGWYASELRARPYTYGPLILPHDARHKLLGADKTIQAQLEALNFKTVIAPSVSVMDGIEAVRRHLPKMWIDEAKCGEGLRALREYRERFDDQRRVGMGPLHDWTSHCADSLRYLALVYDEPRKSREDHDIKRRAFSLSGSGQSWLGA